MRISGCDQNLLARILNHLVGFSRADSNSVILAYEGHVEGAAFQHAGEMSLAVAYG